jgi:hypothetical protein
MMGISGEVATVRRAGGCGTAAVLSWALLVSTAAAAASAATAGAPIAPARRTANLVLVTLDGVRVQEVFGGMDDTVASSREKRSGIYDVARARRLYWRATAAERRAALWPFFWGTLAPQGIVLGDAGRGSRVMLRNPHAFSAPGYMELLTGAFRPEVTTNDARRYPHPTVLQAIRRELGLRAQDVAVFSTWDALGLFASSEEGAVFVNAGYARVPAALSNPVLDALGDYQEHVMALWEGYRTDMPTFHLALEYLKAHHPRVLYLALGETDDWAHARRYDRLLDCLRLDDDYLRILWTTLQSLPEYRDRTTLIVTTDHGRGRTPKDWVDHGEGIRGSEEIWIALIGPDTPDVGAAAGVAGVHQADVAATMLDLLGLPGTALPGETGPPITLPSPHGGAQLVNECESLERGFGSTQAAWRRRWGRFFGRTGVSQFRQ